MNEGYCSNSTNLITINREKKKERSENFERESAGVKGEEEEEKRGKYKGSRKELK